MTITNTISTLAVDATTIDAADVTTVDNELLTIINNIVNGLSDVEALRMVEISTPAVNPAATKHKLYFKTTGLYSLDSAGTETLIYGAAPDVFYVQVFS